MSLGLRWKLWWVSLCAVGNFLLLAAEDPKAVLLEVPYVPAVVYRGEPLTFKVSAAETQSIQIHTNEVEMITLPPGNSLREVTMRPTEGGMIQISAATEAWDFRLVDPADGSVKFEERDGYLFADGAACILLPDHKIPLPLDRRWETLEAVSQVIGLHKPMMGQTVLVSPPKSTIPKWVEEQTSADLMEIKSGSDETWFRLHQLLQSEPAPKSEWLIVEMDLTDLQQGVPEGDWLMKWQFVLQRLQHQTGYESGILISPDFSGSEDPWYGLLDRDLRSLAGAHGLLYVDRALSDGDWQERLLNQLGRKVSLK